MQRRAPVFGFPVVASRTRDARNPHGLAFLVDIRYGAADPPRLATIDDPVVLRALGLDRLLVPASRLLGAENLDAEWSVTASEQESPDLLKGYSGQLAALLALATSPVKQGLTRPGLLDAGVIWATGSVIPTGNVVPVREDDFRIKLHAFLLSEDCIFLAPESDWFELLRAEGSAMPSDLTLLSLSEFRATADLPGRDWRGSDERPRKWGVRLPEGPVGPVLGAVLSNLREPEADPSIDPQFAATVRFDHATNALRRRPDDSRRLDSFLLAAKALGDWSLATDELCANVHAHEARATSLAFNYAVAVSKHRPADAEPLWTLVRSLGPEVDTAERALLDIYRADGRRPERIALLRSRAASDRIAHEDRVAARAECAELLNEVDPLAALEEWLHLLAFEPACSRALAGIHEVIRKDPAAVPVLLNGADGTILFEVIDSVVDDRAAANLVELIVDQVKPPLADRPFLQKLARLSVIRFRDLDLALRALVPSCTSESFDESGVDWIAPLLDSESDVGRLTRVFSAVGAQRHALNVLTLIGADDGRPSALRFRALSHALTCTSDPVQIGTLDRALLSLAGHLSPKEASLELFTSAPEHSPAIRSALIERSLKEARGQRQRKLLAELGDLLYEQGRVVDALDRYRDAAKSASTRNDRLHGAIVRCASELIQRHRDSGSFDAAAWWTLGTVWLAFPNHSWVRSAYNDILVEMDDWPAAVVAIEERSRDYAHSRIGAELLLDLSRLALRLLDDPVFALDLWCRAWRLEPGFFSAREPLNEVLRAQPSAASPRTRWHASSGRHTAGFHDGLARLDLVAFAEDQRSMRVNDEVQETARFPLDDATWTSLIAAIRCVDAQVLQGLAISNEAGLRSELLNAVATAEQHEECISLLCHLEALHGGGEFLGHAAEIALAGRGQPCRALELFQRADVHRQCSVAAAFSLTIVRETRDLDVAVRALAALEYHFSKWKKGEASLSMLAALADLKWDCCRDPLADARSRIALLAMDTQDERPIEALIQLARETSDLSWVAKSLESLPRRAAVPIVRVVCRHVADRATRGDAPDVASIVLLAELLLTTGEIDAAFESLAQNAHRHANSWRFRVQFRSVARRAGRLAEAAGIYQRILEVCTDTQRRATLTSEIKRCQRTSR